MTFVFFILFNFVVSGDKVDTVSLPRTTLTSTTTTTIPTTTTTTVRDVASLVVPYTVQAPWASWNIHEESCEEAVLLMYHYFLEGQIAFGGKTVIPPTTASDEMLKMKKWQVASYGNEPDLTIEAIGKFANAYYGYSSQVYKNITKEDVKREISSGNPVLVPVMTHSLLNSHYGLKSVYHILLIKGYNSLGAITNDPGIKEGKNYFYSWDTIMSAIDAQTPKMAQGREMLVLTK